MTAPRCVCCGKPCGIWGPVCNACAEEIDGLGYETAPVPDAPEPMEDEACIHATNRA